MKRRYTRAIMGAAMNTLKELRELRALSQRDLARLAKVDETTIIDLEKGRRPPRPSTRRKLAKALKVRPQDIDFGAAGHSGSRMG